VPGTLDLKKGDGPLWRRWGEGQARQSRRKREPRSASRAAGTPLRRSRDCAASSGSGWRRGRIVALTLKTRPDYAITLRMCSSALSKSKRPAKAPILVATKVTIRTNWQKLQSLPICSTPTNSFSLWQNGELVGSIVTLEGDIENVGREARWRRWSSSALR